MSEIEIERRNRIRLSVFCYAYELMGDSLISDHEWDKLAYKIRPELSTGNDLLDEFFRNEFKPHTGQWVWAHPEQSKLHELYMKFYKEIAQ